MDHHKAHKHTELQRISHLLDLKESDLSFLEDVSLENLKFLYEKIENGIYKEQSGIWEPLAKVCRYLPNFLNAKVSEEILGPGITANITYHVPVKDAVSIASHFSIKFFCDVVEHLVPAKIEHIIDASPISQMRQAFKELMKRENYYIVGGLIDHTPLDKVVEISKDVTSDSMLLLLSNYVSRKERISAIMESYEDKKIRNILITSVNVKQTDIIADAYEFGKPSLKERLKKLILSLEDKEQKETLSKIIE